MLENTGSVKRVAKGYGRNMVQLNVAQIKMREAYLKSFIASKRSSPDTSEFCFLCEMPGDNRQVGSLFTTIIPCNVAGHPECGLVMDAIHGIWVCASCARTTEEKK